MNVSYGAFCLTHDNYCNSARQVIITPAGQLYIPFFPHSYFGFLYRRVVLQFFNWNLIARGKSCIATHCYEIVQWLFKLMMLKVLAELQAIVSEMLSAFHW